MPVQPGDREIAPGPLSLVQSFVNSVNVEFGPDHFATAESLGRWLDRYGLGRPPAVTETERRRAVELREAIRELLRENNGGPVDPRARAAITRIARDCPLVVEFGDEPAALAPAAAGVDGALGAVLAVVVTTTADGSWSRLKACREHVCEWAFYDRSRNRGGRWCSMQVCGTRSKMRTYRAVKPA